MADPYGYDEFPYPSAPYPYTHPDRLATLATLFGLETAAIEDSRVLEVGCADGANLIPMALSCRALIAWASISLSVKSPPAAG